MITNPPFSLLKEYIPKIIEYNKDFLIIAGISTISIKNIFELIKENKIWLGMNFGRGVSGFIVPEEYELYGSETKINEKNERIISPNNCLWLTTLQNKKREQILELKENYEENKYAFYDNYPAINVNKTKDIPIGYKGMMGVPITFLNKFNPKQFEIVGFRKGVDGKDLRVNGKSLFCRILVKIRY